MSIFLEQLKPEALGNFSPNTRPPPHLPKLKIGSGAWIGQRLMVCPPQPSSQFVLAEIIGTVTYLLRQDQQYRVQTKALSTTPTCLNLGFSPNPSGVALAPTRSITTPGRENGCAWIKIT